MYTIPQHLFHFRIQYTSLVITLPGHVSAFPRKVFVGNAKASLKPKPKTTPFPVLQVEPPPFKKPTYQKSSVKSEK